MVPNTRLRAKILSVLVCFVLIDKGESTNARTELQKLQGSFKLGQQSSEGGHKRDAVDEPETRKNETSISRELLQRTRQSQSRVESACDLSSEDVDRFYDASSQQWLIDDDVLEELDNDVQAVIECANENDTLLFVTDQTIKPKRTLVFSQNLTLSPQSEAEGTARGVVSVSERVQMTCPDSGQLILSRSPSFTIKNLVVKDCDTASSVIDLDPDCSNERLTGSVSFHGMTLKRNVMRGQGNLLNSSNARCLRMELNNVSIRRNRCAGPCVLLSSNNTLNNIALESNEESDGNSEDSSIFSAAKGSEISAVSVTSESNAIRSFQLTNSTMRMADSRFSDNQRSVSSASRDNSIGGGVIFSNYSSCSISGTIFENNYAFNGGALFAWSSNISINDCVFHENDAGEGNGGALYGHYNSSFDVSSSLFSNNRGYFGAGVYSNYTRRVEMVNISVWENRCSRSCGISIDYGIARIESSEFLRNIAARAGGTLCTGTSNVSLTTSTFIGNSARFGGACMFTNNSTINASNLLFENNTAWEMLGGGIRFAFGGRMRIRDSMFRNNRAFLDGGAISVGENCETILKRVEFLNNTSRETAGALQIWRGNFIGSNLVFTRNSASKYGGAISFFETTNVSVYNSHFEDNHAAGAGAIQFFSTPAGYVDRCTFVRNSGYDSFGGALHARTSNVNISSSLFRANTASIGGSVAFYEHCNLTIVNSTFESNVADSSGGAISMNSNSSLILSNSTISGNRGQVGGALVVSIFSNASLSLLQLVGNYAHLGGCLYLYDFGRVSILNSLFSNNVAEIGGGAVYSVDNSEFTMSNSTVVGNNGGSYGGGVQVSSNSTLLLTDVSFEKNEADRGGAVSLYELSNATITNCSFRDNLASNYGGAINLYGSSTASLTNSTISGNQASFGGGLFVWTDSTALVQFSNFARNNASISGGGIYLDASIMLLMSSQLEANNARFGGSLFSLNATVEVTNLTIHRSHARSHGGAIYMRATNATLAAVRLESNEAMVSGGGMALINATSLQCVSCLILNNTASSGAGLYAYSNNSISIVAQLQNSRFENNSAESYGGGIEFAAPQNRSINCSSPNVTCGHIILLNTSFEGNYANHSGAIVLTTDPNRVLVNCAYRGGIRGNQDFLNRTDINSLKIIDPRRLCTSWKRNRLTSSAYGDVVGTYGQEIVLTIDPEAEVKLVGSTRTGYVLENVSSGRQLPTINVTILDGYGVGPAPTLPHSFEARLSSPDGLFNGLYPTTIAAGVGNISRVIGLVIPGTYTLEFAFDNEVFETFNVTVIVRGCQVGEESTRDGLTCQACDAFSYNFNASQIGGCKECPGEATCRGRYIVPKNGHWHKSPCHDTIQECLIEEACTNEGREEALMNYTQNSTDCNINETTIESYNDVLCNEGYKGPLCGSCKKSFGLSVRYQCSKCASTFLSLLTIFGIALYLLGASSLTIRGCLPSNLLPQDYQPAQSQSASASETSRQDPEVNVEMVKMMVEGHVPREYIQQRRRERTLQKGTQSNLKETEYELTRWRSTEIFKIMLNYLQTIAVAATISVKWTGGMLTLFEASEYVGALTTVAASRPVDCIASSSSVVVKATWRMLVSVFVPGVVVSIFASIWGCIAFKEKRGWSYFWKRFTLSAIAVTYISYLGLTKMALRAFYCVSIYNSTSPSANSKERLWAVDTAIKCYGKEHSPVIAIAVLVILIITVCFPLISALILSCNKEEQKKRDSWIFETAGFLFRVFEKKLVFWESVVMFRKACLSLIVVFSYPLGGDSQGLLASILLLFCLYLQLTLRPYRKEFKRLNLLESISLLVSAVTFNLSLFFVHDRCSDLVRTLLSTIIIFANCMFFVFLLSSFAYSTISHLRVALRYENIPIADTLHGGLPLKSILPPDLVAVVIVQTDTPDCLTSSL